MQIVRANKKLLPQIKTFFKANESNEFFRPLSRFGSDYAEKIVRYKGKNEYYFIEDKRKVLAYGFLRGWDEEWIDKCLGICVRADQQGNGFGEILCRWLEVVARKRGLKRLRLSVSPDNKSAMKMYRKLGYFFTGERKNNELVLFKVLK